MEDVEVEAPVGDDTVGDTVEENAEATAATDAEETE